VVFLAAQAKSVTLLVRRPLAATMSQYLVERIEQLANVEVVTGCRGLGARRAEGQLESIRWREIATGAETRRPVAQLFSFIGAEPNTDWLRLRAQARRPGLRAAPGTDAGEDRLPLETSRRGVFAVGDVRAGSVKRVAASVGDGAQVVRRFINIWLYGHYGISEPRRFRGMLNESLGGENETFEGKVVKGIVTGIENDLAVIDVGLKSEGRVALREFAMPGQKAELKVGDEVEVYVDRVENAQGEAMLSRDRARREAAWDKLEKEFEKGERVDGVIFGRVKGGFTVDLGGAVAFLPGSQVDIRPVRDVGPLMDLPQPFQILKMDRRRGNIVVSRRAILEETRAEQRSGLILSLAEGQVIEGVVKNITDYGAFVDLGGIDGLLHVTDISYKRVSTRARSSTSATRSRCRSSASTARPSASASA
jgi:DNA-directed RNA polymerase subunit E'/Rpb7